MACTDAEDFFYFFFYLPSQSRKGESYQKSWHRYRPYTCVIGTDSIRISICSSVRDRVGESACLTGKKISQTTLREISVHVTHSQNSGGFFGEY